MAIVVEDGTIVTGANSYVTEAELTAYATARAYTLVSTAAVLIIKAMDYIEGQSFIGIKSTEDQPLAWPRNYVYIDGYAVDSDEIPQELKNAEMATALAIDAGNSPMAVISPQKEKAKVGPVEVTYKNGGVSNPIDPAVSNALKKLVLGGGANQVRVNKA
jgi:hypothetical protein